MSRRAGCRGRRAAVFFLLIGTLLLAPASSAFADQPEGPGNNDGNEGNPPSVECGQEDPSYNKFQFDGVDNFSFDEGNTDPNPVIELTNGAGDTVDYENTDTENWTLVRIVIKSGNSDGETEEVIDDPDQSGTLDIPSDISHLTFCFGVADGPPPDEICDNGIDDDEDGLVDEDDEEDCPGTQPRDEICDNEIDDDGDGLVDEDDEEDCPPDNPEPLDCPEGTFEFDSDGDGEPDTCVLPEQETAPDETKGDDDTQVLGKQLAKTGPQTDDMALAGAGFVVAGALLVAAGRRKRPIALPVASSAVWIGSEAGRRVGFLSGSGAGYARRALRFIARRARVPDRDSPG